jgi:glycosyltransferase involved in cell wall biosynthesis
VTRTATSQTSVIIPVRNGAKFIADALVSVLHQLDAADEVIIVDDASTDATRSIVNRMGDGRIRLIDGFGRGASSARNIGLALAKGEFVAFLDHDDAWPVKRHSVMVQTMIADPRLDAVFGRIRIQVDSGGTLWPFLRHQDGQHAPGSNLGNALYRGSTLRRLDGFDESLKFGEDLDYFHRLLQGGIRFDLCDVDGLIYRRHASNVTNDLERMQHMHFEFIRRHLAQKST